MGASFFAIANILAGVINYLYHVLASKQMVPAEFAEFSVWFARVSVFCMLGGLLQYAGNFFPTSRSQLNRSLFLAIAGTGILTLGWLLIGPNPTVQTLFIVLASGVFGWILGQIQQRLLFALMGVLNLALAGSKILFLLIPGTILNNTNRYAFALIFGYFAALVILWIASRIEKSGWTGTRENPNLQVSSLTLWAAPVLLSFSGSLIPQVDILLLETWQPVETFQIFVRASLFYKGIYFLMFIFAQWMLPHQVSKTEMATRRSMFDYKFALAAILGSALVAVFAPLVGEWILRWEWSPPRDLIFYSCLNMSLLTWIFLLIQEACARHQVKEGVVTLALVLMSLLVQWGLKLEVTQYFQLGIVIYTLVIFLAVRRLSYRK